MSCHRRPLLFVAILLLILPLTVSPVAGQSDDGEAVPSFWEKFEFHGFLTQAYAKTDGEPYLGMTEDGTWNYRNVALQFRYAINDDNHLVFQLDNEALGESPIEELRDDVQLDWAFYEHRYHRGTGSVRVGRSPTPIGIYNEVRNVGNVLPFYSPPTFMYGQVLFNAETLDGVALSNRILPAKDWNFDLDAYVGEWEFVENESRTNTLAVAKARNAVGARLWVNTPILGLRFGGGGYTFEATEGILRVEEEDRWKVFMGSVDASLSSFWVRAEYMRAELPVSFGPFVSSIAKPKIWYAQAGWDATARLKFAVQYEEADFEINAPFPLPPAVSDDLGFSVRYQLLPETLLRAEYHTGTNYFVDREVNLLQGDPIPDVDYFNVSVAVSF